MASCLLHSYRLGAHGSFVSLLAKRRYRMRPGTRAEALPDVVPFRTAPEFSRVQQAEGESDVVLRRDSDLFCCVKPLTDVLLRGRAHSRHGAVRTLDTGLEVGSVRKVVRVHGDRSVTVSGGERLGFTDPEPFTQMPLVWERAYGGRDVYAEKKLRSSLTDFGLGRALNEDGEEPGVIGYPRNGVGQGFALALDVERLHGSPVPNLEDPEDVVAPARLTTRDVHAWLDLPTAACYAPIHYYTFPRATFFVPPAWAPPTRPVRELGTGGVLQADLDAADERLGIPDSRVANCAPAGLAVCRLEGGERVKLWNVHPKHDLLEFDLPGERPRLYVEFPNVGSRGLANPVLQTLELDPEEDAVTMTWVAHAAVASPFPESLLSQMRHGVTWERAAP